MQVAIVTFEGFNEIDSFVALHILNRVKRDDWKVYITAPSQSITSMNGVIIQSQKPLEFANEADVVLFGSGRLTRQVIQNEKLMAVLQLNPERQLIGSQCSGALILKKLGLVEAMPVCTDNTTRPYLLETGAEVLNQAFYTQNNIATAGGCLSSQYLAAWVIYRIFGQEAMLEAIKYVAPVGEENMLVEQMLENLQITAAV